MSKTNCPNCGAPRQGMVCAYCGTSFREQNRKIPIVELVSAHRVEKAKTTYGTITALIEYHAESGSTEQVGPIDGIYLINKHQEVYYCVKEQDLHLWPHMAEYIYEKYLIQSLQQKRLFGSPAITYF